MPDASKIDRKPDFSGITPYQTRKTLIEKCKAADPDAWMAFYEPYRKYAQRVIAKKCFFLSETEHSDLAHEVMVKVAEAIENFDPEMPSPRNPGENVKFRAWFYNQIRTVVRTYCRKWQKQQMIFEFDPEQDADLAAFDSAFHKEREEAILAKTMDLLTQSRTNKRNIEAFQMFLNGRSIPDIAAELDMSENSVHQAVCRCRRFLAERRNELEDLL